MLGCGRCAFLDGREVIVVRRRDMEVAFREGGNLRNRRCCTLTLVVGGVCG